MKNIAIICGGFSGEYDISIQSAHMVSKNIDQKKFKPYIIVIKKDRWYYNDDGGNVLLIDKDDFSLTINGAKVKFDGVFNAIHGTPGEDGKILGYFDMLGIPYSSCSADVSSLTFNKYLCNNFIKSLGVNTAKSVSYVEGERIDYNEIVNALGLPVFVKPANSGSSVGVSKVHSINEFERAIQVAFKIDTRIIIEEMLVGREIDCGAYKQNHQLVILPLTEIISTNEFFDYEAKYTAGKADEITPPVNLPAKHEFEIKATSSLIYNKLGCRGIVRIDYILTKKALYFIEINSVPGLSKASIVPKQALAMGIDISNLFNTVLEEMFYK